MNIPKIPHMPNVMGLVGVGKSFLKAHRPEMLLGASLVGTIGTGVLAAKGGYEARGIVEQHESGRRIKSEPPLTTKEKIQLTWLCYLPAVGVGCTTLGATTALHVVHVSEKKMLAGMALAAIEEVKAEASNYKEIIEGGTDAEGKVHVQNSDGEIEEMYLVRDLRTGRDIWSNQNRIETAIIEVANVINGSEDCELGHFYHHAGFANVPDSSDVGWTGVHPDLEWGTTVRDDGRPVRTFKFRPEPEKGFDSKR